MGCKCFSFNEGSWRGRWLIDFKVLQTKQSSCSSNRTQQAGISLCWWLWTSSSYIRKQSTADAIWHCYKSACGNLLPQCTVTCPGPTSTQSLLCYMWRQGFLAAIENLSGVYIFLQTWWLCTLLEEDGVFKSYGKVHRLEQAVSVSITVAIHHCCHRSWSCRIV